MKKISDFLKESIGKVDFAKELLKLTKTNSALNEADDDFTGDDAGADTGDDMGDLGDDLGGGDLGGDFGDSSGDFDDGTEDDNNEEKDSGDDEEKEVPREDDPDFTEGIKNPDSVVLDKMPSGDTVYDADAVFKSIKGVIETLPKTQLGEIEGVKNCLELIFSGKKLIPEDLDFDDLSNAVFLFNKILEPINDRTKNYAKIKLKQPLQQARDKEKLEIADELKNLDKKRDAIFNIDKIK